MGIKTSSQLNPFTTNILRMKKNSRFSLVINNALNKVKPFNKNFLAHTFVTVLFVAEGVAIYHQVV